MSQELTSKSIYLRSHEQGQTYDESFAKFIRKTSELVQRKVDETELSDYNQELGAALGESVGFLYFTRKHRDKELGEAFECYPRKTVNSEEQVALSRMKASAAIRNHEITKELIDALKHRIRITTQHIQMKAMER